MLSLLPDLTPRDSHSLWYTSSRNPLSSSSWQDAALHGLDPSQAAHANSSGGGAANAHPNPGHPGRRAAQHLVDRSPLARLRADEAHYERRRQNVAHFGAGWLKPPGIPKTLHQIREERREAEEHAEAMRREQLAQELAEAEAAGVAAAAAAAAAAGEDGALVVEGMAPPVADLDGDAMDDVQLDGARDLDEEIPEAEDADFGLSGEEEEEEEDDDDEDEDEEEEEDDEDDDDDEEEDEDEADEDAEATEARRAYEQQLMTSRMRQANDAFREDVARGRDSTGYYGVDEEVDEEDAAQMLEEEDLAEHHQPHHHHHQHRHIHRHHHRASGAMSLDDASANANMDADLDDEIPEAESARYEHTDSDAELSSDDEDEDEDEDPDPRGDQSELSFANPQANRFRHSLARSDATRHSLAVSDILSRDGSSILIDSPIVRRPPGGPARR
ncbi:Apc15p protein-domain-containing protein [Xylariomycetidae sp. FL0641]|nr:Apc15p protein-domain-containing protein [Xylariomycetidae sp. FL0641]